MAKTKWVIDNSHSRIGFKVRHLMISWVQGQFEEFSGYAETDGDDFSTATAHFTANANSINTANEQRDAHLRSADFFDAENHADVVFDSTSVKKLSEEEYEVTGNLSIRGVTKPITLKVEHGGVIKDPWGNIKAGFVMEGRLSRKEFGLTWSAVTETGGIVVADEVRLVIEVEVAKEQEAVSA